MDINDKVVIHRSDFTAMVFCLGFLLATALAELFIILAMSAS